jgi:immune inhibitor A
MSRNGWIAFISGLVIACLCLSVCSGTALVSMVIARNFSRTGSVPPIVATPRRQPTRTVRPSATPRPLQRNPTATPKPRPAATATPGDSGTITGSVTGETTATPVVEATTESTTVSSNTLEMALSAVLPPENLDELAVRFKGVTPAETQISCTVEAKGYEVGATRDFNLSNQDTNSQYKVTASLAYKNADVYMWVERSPNRVSINNTALRRAADQFSSKILATNRAFFGEEAKPGIDCDPHLNILHAEGLGSTVGGYFSSPDEYPVAVRPDSNVAEMFVVNAEPGSNGSDPGSGVYMSTLAHELQHMISFNQNHTPSLWLEEGASQLAERLNGYADEVSTVYMFAGDPGTQLNTWSESSAGENSAHYGGGYLFWSYLYDRFGADVTQQAAHSKERSIPGVMQALADAGIVDPDTNQPFTFEDLFADWVIANYMGREPVAGSAENRWNYSETDVPPMSTSEELGSGDLPYENQGEVSQFGTQYIQLEDSAPVDINFTGSTQVPLLPMNGADGRFWYSNRADESNPRLTREFDLTQVKSATLKYRAWYRMEVDFDYGYLSVSTDNGATWKIVKTPTCVTTNPNGSNLGCGYTGPSGSGDQPEWIDEEADLTPFAGQKVLVRFEVVSDAGVNREGLAIDDIQIPEIDYKDDVNGGTTGADDAGWKAEGFIRADNVLPQYWRVQVILSHDDGATTLERIPLTDAIGSITIDFGNGIRRAVLAVSATTQVTTEPGTYQLKISPK